MLARCPLASGLRKCSDERPCRDVQAELAWERATAEVRSHQVAKRIGYSASISQLRWVNFTRRGFIKAPLVGAMFRTSEMGGNKCWEVAHESKLARPDACPSCRLCADLRGHRTRNCRSGGLPKRDNDNPGQPSAAAAAEVRRQDRAQRRAIDTLVASTRGASQGRTEHPLDYDRRNRFWRYQHVRRCRPDALPTVCAIPTSTRQHFARRPGRRSSLVAIITRWASGSSPSKRRAFLAMTAS